MKTLIIFFVALLLGLALGCVFTLRHADHEMAEVVATMQAPYEASERVDAARGIRAIEFIESGDSSNAVRLLSTPIVDYYYFNAKLEHNDERTKETLSWIERFVSTNRFIADEITNRMQGKF
ncbi:MAG TPA: hypothetical protein VG347_17720 [Verrucomicrobiae bacterium]|nr:hypothetical protein [Verrucomicrobiae bacterium]